MLFAIATRPMRRRLSVLVLAGALGAALAGCAGRANPQVSDLAAQPSARAEALTPNQLLERSRSLINGADVRSARSELPKTDGDDAIALAMANERARLMLMSQKTLEPDLVRANPARQEITSNAGRPPAIAGANAQDADAPKAGLTQDEMMARLRALARSASNARATETAATELTETTAATKATETTETFADRAGPAFGALTPFVAMPVGATMAAPLR